MSTKLTCTPDMIFALAERFALLSVTDLWAYPLWEHYSLIANNLEHCGWKRKTGMTQVDKMLKHMHKTGSISQREAYIDYGIQSFHRRLSDIRALGHRIVGVRKHHPVTGQEYTRYYLASEDTPSIVFRSVG